MAWLLYIRDSEQTNVPSKRHQRFTEPVSTRPVGSSFTEDEMSDTTIWIVSAVILAFGVGALMDSARLIRERRTHVTKHRERGNRIPEYAFRTLRSECLTGDEGE